MQGRGALLFWPQCSCPAFRSHSGDLLDPDGGFRSGRKIGGTGKSTAVVIADPKVVKSEAVVTSYKLNGQIQIKRT